jgi:hypothetical protein
MPVRVLKNRPFARWAKGEQMMDAVLCNAAREIEAGLVDARLGGFLLKKRIGKGPRGKRGGVRVIVAHRKGDRLIFLFGFAKNDRDNIEPGERKALHKLAGLYMAKSDADVNGLVGSQVLLEVRCNG